MDTARFYDTEAKILEDIASQIKYPNIFGKIDLYTELDTCQSCSNIILEFRKGYPNIQLNIYTK
nr:deaminase domain-containing protein [Bacillus sp. AFS023182]